MNDPDIAGEAMPMHEIHAIRLMIHDETKDMTPEEHTAYFRNAAREMTDKYGLKVKCGPHRIAQTTSVEQISGPAVVSEAETAQ
ncbi:MAG: hypothetical protein LBS24_08005 [Clostridiales Family XIII bacterium]|nr:hypothetical protein [Clostridiales Family XIII bacterium]